MVPHSSIHFLLASFLLQSISTAYKISSRASSPSLYLCSDSTAASYNSRSTPLQGFGYYLGEYFSLNFHNRARAGRSTRSFINQGLWALLLDMLIPGDYVVIEMGHNDAVVPGTQADYGKDRGVLRGVGEEELVVTNTTGGDGTETVYTFGHYLRRMIADVRERQAIPILSGMVPTMSWQGEVLRTHWVFTEWARLTAESEGAGWVGHTGYSVERFQSLGMNKSMDMFPLDHTHTNAAGAVLNAETFVTGVKCGYTVEAKALRKWLNSKGKAVEWKC